MTNEVLVWRSG